MARIRALPAEISARYYPKDYFAPIQWSEVFGNTRPVEIELGAGDGSFLIRYAQRQPGINLLGIERLLGRIRKIDRDADKAGVNNIRLMRIEAGYFMQYLPEAQTVDAVHVYFPDPWPKKRHHKNRLISPPFVAQCARLLKHAGCVHLRTDFVEYFEQMVEVFDSEPAFTRIETPASLKSIKTDFETDFNREGIETNYATYRFQPTTGT